jgi:phage regulator Rha-like protein
MTGIVDPGGVSGTFAALERTTPIVVVADNGDLTTTSMRVANGTGNEHASVLRLIRDNLADLNEFGRVGFEIAPFDTAGGVQRREVAVLNEQHATLLMTYLRNSDVVREFKKRLVHEFYRLRNQTPLAIPNHAEALRGWAAEIEARELAESKVRELAGPASSWNELAEAVYFRAIRTSAPDKTDCLATCSTSAGSTAQTADGAPIRRRSTSAD